VLLLLRRVDEKVDEPGPSHAAAGSTGIATAGAGKWEQKVEMKTPLRCMRTCTFVKL